MAHYICQVCGTDHPTSEGKIICGMEHREGAVLHPTYSTTTQCEVFECAYRRFRIEDCRDRHCPFMGERRAAEDRRDQEAKDRRAERASEIAEAINHLEEVMTRRIEQGHPLSPEEKEQIGKAMDSYIQTCEFFGMEE